MVTTTVAKQHIITSQEEVGISDSLLDVPRKHTWYHHAQCHECSADSIVGCLEFTFGEVHHVEHVGRETEAVAELFDGDGG